MRKLLERFLADTRGITSVEYALLLAFVAATIAAAISALALVTIGIINSMADTLNG